MEWSGVLANIFDILLIIEFLFWKPRSFMPGRKEKLAAARPANT
jgi:hypothetical protein